MSLAANLTSFAPSPVVSREVIRSTSKDWDGIRHRYTLILADSFEEIELTQEFWEEYKPCNGDHYCKHEDGSASISHFGFFLDNR